MGVSIDAWRQSIGLFDSRKRISLRCCDLSDVLSGMLTILHVFSVLCALLVIGGIELNPGPTTPDFLKPCCSCPFKAKTADQHIYHQQIHANAPNFGFECPFPRCAYVCKTFKVMSSHLSYHSTRRDQVIGEVADGKCQYCDLQVGTNNVYIKHLKDHLDEGFSVICPLKFENCSRREAFTSKSVFSSLLSQCHPGWKRDYSSSALSQDHRDMAPTGLVQADPPFQGDNRDDFQSEDLHLLDQDTGTSQQMEEEVMNVSYYDNKKFHFLNASFDCLKPKKRGELPGRFFCIM